MYSLNKLLRFLILVLCLIGGYAHAQENINTFELIELRELPIEAQQTLELIQSGKPLPYAKDGIIFNNRERQLPFHKRGYYHEYTVPTPGAKNRGARRLVIAKNGEIYYTDNHYRSFKKIRRPIHL